MGNKMDGSLISSLARVKPVKDKSIATDLDEKNHRQAKETCVPSAILPVAGTLFERKPWLLKPVPDLESVLPNTEITWEDFTPKQK